MSSLDICAYAAAAAACAYMCWVEFCSVREFVGQKERRPEGLRQQGRHTRPANQALQVKSRTIACSCHSSRPEHDECCLLRMYSLIFVCRDEANMGASIGWFQGCHEMVSVWMSAYLTQFLLSQASAAACSEAEQ